MKFFITLFIILNFLFGYTAANSLECNHFQAGTATLAFCQEVACSSYCRSTSLPYYCMQANYVKPGYCVQVGGFPTTDCQKVTGIDETYTHWCQTIGCNYTLKECLSSKKPNCVELLPDLIEVDFKTVCKGNVHNTVAPPVTTSTAITTNGGQTTSTTKKVCSRPQSTSSTVTTTTKAGATTTVPTTTRTAATTAVSTTTRVTVTTKSTTTENPNDIGGCWAAGGWSGQPCEKCTAPQGNSCPQFSWTVCYGSKNECNKASGGGSVCASADCPKNTLGFSRPTFKGPSCYNSAYGSQFGPNWVPTGKTHFERLITNPTELYKMIQTTADDLPWLQKTWNLKGCKAASAVYENVVCSIEILQSLNKKFEGPQGQPGASIDEFCNNGDHQTDLREVAAFFSHKFKETARLQTWEEGQTGYIDGGNVNYPPVTGQSYHGRGPVQLSWNYNYGPFSEWFFGNKQTLLSDPSKVDPEGPMGFIAALWFWFTPRDFTSGAPISGSIRTRDAIIHWTDNKMNSIYNDGKNYDAVAGLGLSTNVINGGIECPGSRGESSAWRVMYYLTVAARIGVDIPNMNSPAACAADKYCNGLFSGCTSSAAGLQCEEKDTACGPAYVDGWQTKLCNYR